MIYPENFESKIGFDEIRVMLRGRCMSSLGTEWVDNRLKYSTKHKEVLENLALVSDFMRFDDEEEDVYEENFFDVRQALMRIRPERTHIEEVDLYDLKRSLKTILDLVTFFTHSVYVAEDDYEEYGGVEGEKKYPALARLASAVNVYPQLIHRIDEVLNQYGKVKDSASSELLRIRRAIENTGRSINHSLRSIISEAQHEGYIERDVVPTMRDGRLVIPVAPALKRKIRGIIHDESATGKTVFIEPSSVVDANNKVRELKSEERREVIRILQELSNSIRPHISDMLKSLHFLAHIDYLRALSGFSESFEAVVPEVRSHPHIDWVQAIHPLLQQSMLRHGLKQVPLDIQLRGKQRILLISGPNAGGKSVVLKTVGLLQYMLQCGMPVPMRENSVMGIFNDIFISIGDEQNLENELSTYSSHLMGMKTMMHAAHQCSLILIDEFGGGTEPQIGGAMAEAMLNRFVLNQTYGVITTHFQNLKHYAETKESVVNGAMLYDRAQMQPLFLLRIGHPGSSFAIEIAHKIGIPNDVIQYASDLVGKDYVMSDRYLQDIARDKMYWESKRQKVRTQEEQLRASLENYKKELENFHTERKSVLAKAKEEAQNLLKESNAKIENTIREIREAQAERERTKEVRQELTHFGQTLSEEVGDDERLKRKIEKLKRRQQRKQKQKVEQGQALSGLMKSVKITKRVEAKANKLVEGDYVRLKGQTTIGRIQRITGKLAHVLFGVMRTSVPLSRLEHAQKPIENKSSKISTFVSRETRDAIYEKKLHFKPEIDVRGERADEAINIVRDFIDDAILIEQSRVRILHGTGTGALRRAIRQYLDTIPAVTCYKDEHVQFGGAGITVVELS